MPKCIYSQPEIDLLITRHASAFLTQLISRTLDLNHDKATRENQEDVGCSWTEPQSLEASGLPKRSASLIRDMDYFLVWQDRMKPADYGFVDFIFVPIAA